MRPDLAESPPDSLADRLGCLGLAFREGPGDLAAARRELEILRSALEDGDRPGPAGVVRRVAILTEVWECLDDGPSREVADFCAGAIERLIGILAGDDGEGSAGSLLEESTARWGDYLGLLDPDGAVPTGPAPDDDPIEQDELPAIDAGALLRMLTGAPPPAPSSVPDETPSPIGETRPEEPPAVLDLDPELREAFLAEAADLCERIEALVLGLGGEPDPSTSLLELGRCYHTLKGAAGSVGLVALAARVHDLEGRLEEADGTVSAPLVEALHGSLRDIERTLAALRDGGKADVAPESPEGPLRVSSARVDELMDLVSELITRRGSGEAQAGALKDLAALAGSCRNRLSASIDRFHDAGLDPSADIPGLVRHLTEQAADLAVLADSARASALQLADQGETLDRLTLHLWDALRSIRITPVRGLFQRLARVAHDAARVEGRSVEVVTLGAENGLDRAVQDKVFEPLLHVVRNAVGHGIEAQADRSAAGKPPVGRVTLEARREGNRLVLSVADDGRGLDHGAIAAKARRLGRLGPDETPSVDRLHALIFEPGFSTRDEANANSGRGVGMDVVGREVARLQGTIDLTSEEGRGTRLTVRLPVRLALERAMVVIVGGQAFAVPIELVEHVREFAPIDPEGHDRAAWIDAREALGFPETPPASCPKLLLVRVDGEPLALRVDAIEGVEELVFKPLGALLAGHPMISGTSVTVTGEVILALNPSGLARHRRATGRPAPAPSARRAPVLVVDDSISVRKVVTRDLRALGLEVEEVSDGLEALGRLRGRAYAMVVTDLEMPQMDGFELLAEIGRLKGPAAPPVVVASTRDDPETRRRVLALGARAFVSKPVAADELARAVRDCLSPPGGEGRWANGG